MSSIFYQLQPREDLRSGLDRIADLIADKAKELPALAAKDADEAIHHARLLIKFFRALAWFARPAFGENVHQRMRAHLRAAAPALPAPRDRSGSARSLSQLATANHTQPTTTAFSRAHQ